MRLAIDIIERFNFNLGSAIDCIARADRKPGSGTIADLEKAQWHLCRSFQFASFSGELMVIFMFSRARRRG